MYENIISFFSFPLITRNVRMGRERERERERAREREREGEREIEREWKIAKMHTHRGDRAVFLRNLSAFLLHSPGSKSFLLNIIFRTPTQILVVTPPTYTLHLERLIRACPHATYVVFPLGNNLRPFYFRK